MLRWVRAARQRRASYGDDTSESTSAWSDDETDDEESTMASPMRRVELHVGYSIYDLAFVTPLYHASDSWRGAMTQAVALLALTAVMQGIVVAKVLQLARAVDSNSYEALADVCQPLPGKDFGPSHFPDSQVRGMFDDCSQLDSMLASNVSRLDLDGDGCWTVEEAVNYSIYWTARFPNRHSNLSSVHKALRELLGYSDGAPGRHAALPLSKLSAEQPVLRLCMAVDPEICPNLEVREMLSDIFPSISGEDRIQRCADVLEEHCLSVFGERFALYQARKRLLCGEAIPAWSPMAQARETVFSQSFAYVTSRDSVVRPLYAMFLFMILIIWLSAMLREIREVLMWWVVVVRLPTDPGTEGHVLVANKKIKIESAPMSHKVFSIAAILIPHTVIAAALTYAGLELLMYSDDYFQLVSNSVALAFLSEVDDMLFAAVVSDRDHHVMGRVRPLVVTLPRNGRFPCCCICSGPMQTIAYIAGMVVVAAALEYSGYSGQEGKLEYGRQLLCFCQIIGSQCTAAQVFSGRATLDDVSSLSIFLGPLR